MKPGEHEPTVVGEGGGAANGGGEAEIDLPVGQHDYSHIDRSQVDSVAKLQGFYNEMATTGGETWKFGDVEKEQVVTMDREMLRTKNAFTDFYERYAVLQRIGVAGRSYQREREGEEEVRELGRVDRRLGGGVGPRRMRRRGRRY